VVQIEEGGSGAAGDAELGSELGDGPLALGDQVGGVGGAGAGRFELACQDFGVQFGGGDGAVGQHRDGVGEDLDEAAIDVEAGDPFGLVDAQLAEAQPPLPPGGKRPIPCWTFGRLAAADE